MTLEPEFADSDVIELPVSELRRLLADVERDLTDFLDAVAFWSARYLGSHAVAVMAALSRVLDMPSPRL